MTSPAANWCGCSAIWRFPAPTAFIWCPSQRWPGLRRSRSSATGFWRRQRHDRARRSPLIADDALAAVAAGDAGELAIETGGERPAARPSGLGREREQRALRRLRRTVDDE